MREPKNTSAGDHVAAWIVAHRWLALLIGIVGVGLMVAGAPRIKANFTHTAFFRQTDPMLQTFDAFERQFGNDDAVAIIVSSPSGVFDVETATLIRDLTEELWQVHDVIRVESLANFSWVHADGDDIVVEPLLPDEGPLTPEVLAERRAVALNHEILPDYLVSKDAKSALLYARIKPGIKEETGKDGVTRLVPAPPDTDKITHQTRDLVDKYRTGDHAFFMTGGPVMNYSFKESSTTDVATLMPVVLLMTVIFCFLMLRTIGGIFIPLFVVVIPTLVATFGFVGWWGIEINTMTNILPQIIIAVGVADAVHVLSSFYRARRRSLSKHEAAHYTLSKNFVPTVLTSLSTAIGFYAFSTADLMPVQGLGVAAGTGTLIAWFVSYFLMGPLLVLLPSFVKASPNAEKLDEVSARFQTYTAYLLRHRWAFIVTFLVLASGSVALALQATVNSDPYKYFAEDYPLRKANDYIIANLGGVANFELVIDSGEEEGIKSPEFLQKVEAFERQILEIEGISRTISIVDILRQTNRSLHGGEQAYYRLPESKKAVGQELFLYTMSLPQGMDVNDRITVKNDAIRATLVSNITGSNEFVQTQDLLEKMGRDVGLNVKVTGKMSLYQSMNGYVVDSFITSLSIAVVLISVLLFSFFRSAVIGAVALLPNLIPLVFGGALLVAIGTSLDIGTVLVSSVCLGIAVDDTIHILANFNRYLREGYSPRHAVGLILTHTGPALITTTLVLTFAFGTLAFATFIPNVYFGIMTASILLVALVTDLTFLLALLLVVSRTPEQEPTVSVAT